MSGNHQLSDSQRRLLPLVAYASADGWQVAYTPSGHLRLSKAGLPLIFTQPVTLAPRSMPTDQASPQRARLSGPGGQDG